MRKIKQLIYGITMMGFIATGCTPFDELNTDPTRSDQINPGALLNPVLYEMAVYNWNRYNSYTFPLMQSKVSTSNTNGVGWWYVTDAAGDGTWSTYYKWLNNIREMEQEAVKRNEPNYEAIAITLRSWIYQLLADSFGNVPMTEACRGTEQIFTPKFDTQQTIYQTLIDDLDKANSLFNEKEGLRYNKEGEMLYGTSDQLVNSKSSGILKWKKFCNSLRMRVLLRVMELPEFNAKAELAKMTNDPVTYPVFESNADEALLSITGVFPEEAPMTRPQDFTSYVSLSEFFIDNLVSWEDPRLPIFASQATNSGVKSYIGIPSGYAVAPSFNGSLPNQDLAKAPMKLSLMTYAETEFIKAELGQKQVIALDPRIAYENGVRSAILQWGAEVPDGYFEKETVAYDGTFERIMLQKFYALFFCDYQQWFEYNRTGLPHIPKGEGIPSANTMPRRFRYPANVQRTNMKNYQAAKENMGGDLTTTPLIWQPK